MLETLSSPLPPPEAPQSSTDQVSAPDPSSSQTSSPQRDGDGLEDSGPLLYLSESQQEPLPGDPGESDLPQEPEPGPAEEQPLRPRKETLAMLRKLGLDPPPVVRLRPDDGAFVKLEAPRLRPGERGRRGRPALAALVLGSLPLPLPQVWRL